MAPKVLQGRAGARNFSRSGVFGYPYVRGGTEHLLKNVIDNCVDYGHFCPGRHPYEHTSGGQVSREIGVFIVAGNRLLREALTRILSKKADLNLLGALPYSAETINQIALTNPDVLLIDSATTIMSDLGFIREVRQALPPLKVVVIGMEEDEELFLRVVRAGVVGCVLRDASAVDVVCAVRAVARDEAVCPPRLCLSLFSYVAREYAARPILRPKAQVGLTRREQQLLPMLAQGLTNKEIAAQLNLSEQTVKNHVHHMLQKVGARDRLTVAELLRGRGVSVSSLTLPLK
jgi:two-component system NarL family response regulator